MHWEPDLLVQIGIDALNVNLKFEQDLSNQIMNGYGVSFLNMLDVAYMNLIDIMYLKKCL